MPHDAQQRRQLVDGQLRTADVNDKALLAAILETSREAFVRPQDRAFAYIDRDLPVGPEGSAEPRFMLAPMVFGRMAQAAAVKKSDRVLDVACGTGWSAAVLAQMAASVVALDNEAMVAAARTILGAQSGVELVSGGLAKGVPAKAPYDVIVVEGALEVEPTALLSQLADGGRLVAVMGKGQSGRITLWTKSGTETGSIALLNAAAPLLPAFAKAPGFVF
ncbi:protein-L-isoaspartate O-methyltransferase [Rhizobiales bacterium TNE-4]|nr:protein-L-isoaspartate O-methyltransferase [Rhizobiales bacterium TNE-4]MBV1827180.1 protein-L-isoaspartate O-methyltransferase [Rhizobiales bacterium TNE-4]